MTEEIVELASITGWGLQVIEGFTDGKRVAYLEAARAYKTKQGEAETKRLHNLFGK